MPDKITYFWPEDEYIKVLFELDDIKNVEIFNGKMVLIIEKESIDSLLATLEHWIDKNG